MAELQFQIAILNVWWNNDYKDVRRFSSLSQQQEYFGVKSLFTPDTPRVNFTISDGMNPTLFCRIPIRPLFEILQSNYAIIKDNSESANIKFYYYFIKSIKQDSGDQYEIELELDVWQQYHITASFGRGLVDRAHLNRFKEISANLYKFNFDSDSPLLIDEKMEDYPKVLKSRHELYNSGFLTWLNWVKENIAGWCYVYVDATSPINYTKLDNTESTLTFYPSSYYFMEKVKYAILVYPIYKNRNNHIVLNGTNHNGLIWGADAFDNFLDRNNEYTKVFNAQILPVSIINNFAYGGVSVTISGGNLVISGIPELSDAALDFHGGNFYKFSNTYGLLKISPYDTRVNEIRTKQELISVTFGNELKTYFNKNDLKGSKDILRNPKLYSKQYKEFRFNVGEQNYFSLDPRYIDKVILPGENPYYYCQVAFSLTPRITKIKLMPYISGNGVLSLTQYQTEWGAISYSDMSVPIVNSNYAQFVAENKNFSEIFTNNYYFNALKTVLGRGFAAGGGVVTENYGAVASNVFNIGLYTFDALQQHENFNYQIDNILNAPGTVANNGGEPYYLLTNNELGLFIDVYETVDYIKQRDYDFMYLCGYNYGKIDDFDNVSNIRKYFNFVRGTFNNIYGDINDESRLKLRDIISLGVRLWNIDRPGFDFTLENYENYLDD